MAAELYELERELWEAALERVRRDHEAQSKFMCERYAFTVGPDGRISVDEAPAEEDDNG